MLDFLQKGGIFMYPIIICSVISTAVIIERFFTCRKKLIMSADLFSILKKLIIEKNSDQALNLCKTNSSIFAKLSLFIFNQTKRETAKNIIDENGKRILEKITIPLQILSTISSIAPLLGLLGTVTGMIKVFSVLSFEGVANPESLALGISEALLTTVGGLIVAIFSFVFYKYFQTKLNSIFISIEEKVYYLMDLYLKNLEI